MTRGGTTPQEHPHILTYVPDNVQLRFFFFWSQNDAASSVLRRGDGSVSYLLVAPGVALDPLWPHTNDILEPFDAAHLQVDGKRVPLVLVEKLGAHMIPAQDEK